MRARIKKPLTARMLRLKLARCAALRDAGHDVNASIDEATAAEWLDFYPPRDKSIPQAENRQADQTAQLLASERALPPTLPKPEVRQALLAATAAVKRVA